MILLACIVFARKKYIQYIDILQKGAGSQSPQIGPVSQNRITYVTKIFRHVQLNFYSKKYNLTVSGFNQL